MGPLATVEAALACRAPQSRLGSLARQLHDTPMKKWQLNKDFFVVRLESGSERVDLPVFRAAPNAVGISPAPRAVTREDVHPQQGIFVLHNVLSKTECEEIIGLSEAMGYTEDAPVSLGRDIRHNNNCVWISDGPNLNDRIFDRCKALLPQEISVTGSRRGSELKMGPVAGLNRRWRLYRYDGDDYFSAHTDGAWPGSGLDEENNLVEDMYAGRRLSFLTFLVYLSDDFEGGGTRFHFRGETVTVMPTQGSVLCFFHGHHPLSPLHEGELVSNGKKYVARTDVLYEMPSDYTDR